MAMRSGPATSASVAATFVRCLRIACSAAARSQAPIALTIF